jgi:pyoverdine/dityrosine biosynthesis protein Dit1
LNTEDHFLIREAGRAFRTHEEPSDALSSRSDAAAKLHHLLSSRAINFNSVRRVRAERFWLDRIREAVAREEPVQLAYPLMCKMPNPAKQMNAFGITAGEEATIRFFQKIGELAREFYAPGVKINIASDAVLYNVALQNPPPTAANFIAELRDLVVRCGAEDTVVIHDYVDLLVPFARQYQRAYAWYYERLGDANHPLITAAKQSSLAASVKASLNTSRLGLSYRDQMELFGPAQRSDNPNFSIVEQMASLGLREQIAIKMACDQLNVFEPIWPRHVRVSCHRGIKHGRAVIGLRPYPTYYASSKLLTYHGIALISQDERGFAKLVVKPEVLLRGRSDLLRVENDFGETYLYRAC